MLIHRIHLHPSYILETQFAAPLDFWKVNTSHTLSSLPHFENSQFAPLATCPEYSTAPGQEKCSYFYFRVNLRGETTPTQTTGVIISRILIFLEYNFHL